MGIPFNARDHDWRRRKASSQPLSPPSVILALSSAKTHNAWMLDWDALRFLLAVARDGSTAAAARALGVNQSTLMRRIAALEAGLGLRLFNKQRHGYRLTAEGATLVEQAAAVEGAVRDFTRRAAALDAVLTGSLRVTTAEGMALWLVPQLLNEFHRRHPCLQVDLLIEDRYQDLSDGRADVALRAGRPAMARWSGASCRIRPGRSTAAATMSGGAGWRRRRPTWSATSSSASKAPSTTSCRRAGCRRWRPRARSRVAATACWASCSPPSRASA
jgi:DNA-binding transcriptional LysR family regulator